MRKPPPLQLAGVCPVCKERQETAAPPSAAGRPRLTDRQKCGRKGCDGVVFFRRQPKAERTTPEPPATEPRRNVRRYRRDDVPDGSRTSPAPADEGPGGPPEQPPASTNAGLLGSGEPEPVTQPEPEPVHRRRAERYRGSAGAVYPGIY